MYAESDLIKFIESIFGSGSLSSKGTNLVIHCPNCASQGSIKKKLSIRLDDHVNHCWVCGWGSRSLLALLIKYGDSGSVHEYKTKYWEGKQFHDKVSPADVPKLPYLPRDFVLLAPNLDNTNPEIKHLIKYCFSRGLKENDLWKFSLGYSKEYQYRRRVLMPSFDKTGEINFVTARSTDSLVSLKYINSDIHKNEIIFNEIHLDFKKRITLVEGPFDLIKSVDNSTCLLGSDLSESSKLFHEILFNETPINLCLDSDMQLKSLKLAKKLASYKIDVRLVSLGDNKDPGEMSKRDLSKVVANAKEWDWKLMAELKIKNASKFSMKL